jgi:hypothetical protein
VLELLTRSASEPQAGGVPVPTSRLAAQLMSFGSQGGASHKRTASFLGRQTSVPGGHRGSSNTGFGNAGKSYVFGRDTSQSAAPPDAVRAQFL